MQNGYEHLSHVFEPVYDEHSRILILGTFPSVKSRENQFYYGHPQNRFWRVLARVCAGCGAEAVPATKECPEFGKYEMSTETEKYGESVPETIEEKKAFLLRHHIAIWDVIAQCDIVGSSDSSIRNVVPNDLRVVLDHAPIRQIFANGGKSFELYQKYSYAMSGREIIKLPSTSPANAAFSLDRLAQCWSVIGSYL